MASNMRDTNIAFEATESGLREAEAWLQQQLSEPSLNGGFVYKAGTLPDMTNQTHAWWTNNANTGSYGVAGSTALAEVSTQPRFVLEHRAFVADSLVRGFEPPTGKNIYRVVARGTGATDTAQSIGETTFAKRFN
jgi:type IV pilus assembly protein PilX